MKKRSGDVARLGSLFATLRERFVAPQQTVIDAAVVVVSELLEYEIKPEHCSYTVSSRTLSFQVPSLLKHEIKKREVEILERLVAILGVKGAPRQIL